MFFFKHLNSGSRYFEWCIKTVAENYYFDRRKLTKKIYKKNHIEHKYSVLFESRNNKKNQLPEYMIEKIFQRQLF